MARVRMSIQAIGPALAVFVVVLVDLARRW
jgi:hypothetical protein